MLRRDFVRLLGSSAAVAAFPKPLLARPAHTSREIDWSSLRKKVGDRLIVVRSPLAAVAEVGGAGSDELFRRIKNPYYLGDEPSLTQTLGWIDAWTSQSSAMAVAAQSSADVAAAVDFARQSGVRPVVKGGGHSYFGNSNAAGSLLIWTRRMNEVRLHDKFRGLGWPKSVPAMPAVSVGAGAIWGQVYDKVTKSGRYVQGGGCLTVGVAGFVQGGGFGSLSKAFGTGAANLLEAEVVTADGKVRIVNEHVEPELFFALRGGGGGTFGVVTRVTLKTHPLPTFIGAALFGIAAKSEPAWRSLVDRILSFYSNTLMNPTWGEQIRFAPGWKLNVAMVCHGLDQSQVEAAWRPFLSWVAERPNDYALDGDPLLIAIAGSKFWDPASLQALPGIVIKDDRPGAHPGNIFWATNLSEAGQVLNAYDSTWLPKGLLHPSRRQTLADAIVQASNEWPVSLHTNKGLAGGSAEAIAATRRTATNPEVLDAFALLICAADAKPAWPGIPGHEPDIATGRHEARRVAAAMIQIRRIAPGAGCYVSEANYFGPDWKTAYWGENYARLARAKGRFDTGNLFHGHHTAEFS